MADLALEAVDGGGERVRSSRTSAAVDEMTSAVPSPVDEPSAVAPPASPSSPGTPAASPAASPSSGSPTVVQPSRAGSRASSAPRITRVVRVGRFWKVSVSAPAGKRVVLRMNGRVVASGAKKTFSVPVTRAKTARFSVS